MGSDVKAFTHVPMPGAMLMCYRTSDMPVPNGPSIVGKCKRCGENVWVAMSSPPVAEKICTKCVAAEMLQQRREGQRVVVAPPTEAQQAETDRVLAQKKRPN